MADAFGCGSCRRGRQRGSNRSWRWQDNDDPASRDDDRAMIWLLGACTSSSVSMEPGAPALPAQWQHVPEVDGSISEDWWRSFGSQERNQLIAEINRESLDLAAAAARVRQAQAVARIVGAALLPEASASLNASRQGGLARRPGEASSGYSAGLSTTYEVDLWGRLHAGHDGALAILRASEFDRDTVRLAVPAAVASAWLRAVALRERTGIASGTFRSPNVC
jgi:outer membrane protein TolC